MRLRSTVLPLVVLFLLHAACASPDGEDPVPEDESPAETAAKPRVLRVATFNVKELSRDKLLEIDDEGRGTNPQLRAAAEILQRLRPDVLLVNEIDFDPEERANARLFIERYLAVSQNGQEAIDYPHVFFAPVNTGVPTGLDLNQDGVTDSPEDSHGFGRYPGQYGMALLSRFPIDEDGVKTYRELLWQRQPGNLMPDGSNGKPAWYTAEQAKVLRLSSKSHWDVPVLIGSGVDDSGVDGRVLHVLASHPTPPVFDGEEDRNGRRNFDEIRLFADYLSGGEAAAYLVDDQGQTGGLPAGESFVLLGDQNADPYNDPGDYGRTAISQLLEHPRMADPEPRGPGGEHVEREYDGPKDTRTAEWGRLDYVLPSRDLEVVGSGVFWPAPGDALYRLVADDLSSDHRAVWVDVAWPPS